MTSSATPDFLFDVLGGARVSGAKLAYFQTRLAGLVHQAMLKVFGRLESQGNFTRKELAHRVGRKPEQITRWFSYPGNLTLGTISDIFVGMGYEVQSITLIELETGTRLQCPEQRPDLGQLLNLRSQNQASTRPLPVSAWQAAYQGQEARCNLTSGPSSALSGALAERGSRTEFAAAQSQTMRIAQLN